MCSIILNGFSVSQIDIDFVTINKSGEWLAFGASKLGQLLVWEWQSESYILKQQGHMDSMNSLTYSPDGQRIITSADDGKIKVWDVNTGFCIVTFTEHTSSVTACEFAKRGNNVLFTSSLDGSVRAWDLIRYRNFRTFTAPSRLSFTSLAVYPSGEIVCAGSLDSFDIHIWSVQTGQLLDQLSGHEGPVSSLAFAPSGGPLISGSWDHTVRIWSVFDRTQTSEPLQLQADLLCVAIRPDSRQLAASTLDGQLTFWSISDAIQESGIDGRRDVSGGRKISDRRTAASSPSTKSFSTITYSADGSCLLAGGNSKYICLYSVSTGTLIKKFAISINLSFDGTQEFLNSRHITASGLPSQLIDDTSDSNVDTRHARALPGATRSLDPSLRTTRPTIRTSSLAFSPHARSFCAATTEGLLIYSLDHQTNTFDPIDLSVEITPATILSTLSEKSYLHALIMSFRLNELPIIRRVYEAIPPADIRLIVSELPVIYLPRFLRFVATSMVESPHLEFNLRWLEAVLRSHGRYIKDNKGVFEAEARMVMRGVQSVRGELGRLGDENVYTLDYLLSQVEKEKGGEKKVNAHGRVDGESSAGKVLGEKKREVDGDSSEGDEDDEDEWIGLD
jgi:periodic tryptophan protein 2